MTRRGSSLFELQATVVSLRMITHPNGAATGVPRLPIRIVAPPPAKPGGPPVRTLAPSQAKPGVATAKAFDFGEPVRGGWPYAGSPHPFGLAARVEAFDLGASPDSMFGDSGATQEIASAGDGSSSSGGAQDETEVQGNNESAENEGSSQAQSYSPRSAQAMAAVERDLAELARQLKPPSDESDVAQGLSAGDGDGSSPSYPARPPAGGHRVFDDMAQGMAFATEFRLPPVAVQRLFSELDQEIDASARRRAASVANAKALSAPAYTVSSPPAPAAVPEEVLLSDLAAFATPPVSPTSSAESLNLSAMASVSANLIHIAPEDVVLSEEQAKSVFKWFWPDKDMSTLGPVTVRDRAFAQALIVEGIDSTHDVSIIEWVFKHAYMKVFKDFDAVKDLVKEAAKEAIKKGWFTRANTKVTAETLDEAKIYEIVRSTLANNFAIVMQDRLATGELTY